ncbi:hypothetical protein, partial [Hyella patelloides]|uniref:hypothetical protein n=1 Tax=Hyella patelloides TaxID=1982969 RepID=UPI001C95D69F
MKKKINKKASKITLYMLIGFCLFLVFGLFSLPDSILLHFIPIVIWAGVFSAMAVGIFFGLKFERIAIFGFFLGASLLIFILLISLKNLEIPSLKYGNFIGILLLTLFLVMLSFGTGLMLGFTAKPLVDLVRLNLTEFTKNTNNLPKWIYIFLRDEEKEANLIDFRTQWYGQNS